MARRFFLIVACFSGLVACGGSKTSTDGGTTSGTDAGDAGDGGGGVVRATTCTTPDDTQGDCTWPEYCLSGKCVPPQNVTVTGMDVNSNACITSESAPAQGPGNLDLDRQEDDAGLELLAPNSAIITDLAQIPIESDTDCAKYIGHNTTECSESAYCCSGGNTDPAGTTICAAGEDAVLFEGHAFDPQSHFAKKESMDLDAQFFWMTSLEAPVNFTDTGVFGAAQSGFVIPGTGWSASGGPFIIVQCLMGGIQSPQYPLAVNEYPLTLHFCDTGMGGDGGVAGNSFCTSWVTF